MGLKSFFRRTAKRPAKEFEQVDRLYTRPVPIPEIYGNKPVVQFHAEKGKNGLWRLYFTDIELHRSERVMQGLHRAINAALIKHVGKPGFTEMNFDDTFLVLRELEESYLSRAKIVDGGAEPFDHYMAAHRLLPQQFRDGLDEVYQQRRAKGPDILAGCIPAGPPKSMTPKRK